MHPLYDVILNNVKIDIHQMVEEGHDERALLAELAQVLRAAEAAPADALLKFQEKLWQRPSPAGFPYDEPSDWAAISKHFPDPQSHARFRGGEQALADRIHAAWLGRCVGCQLGKPLEGLLWPDTMRKVLQFVRSWPLTDYMNPVGADVRGEEAADWELLKKFQTNPHTKGRFSAVSPDDDIHYALISQRVLEKFGPEFTSEQAMSQVIHYTPGAVIFAAGRNMWRTGIFGLKPPATAVCGNPCRQSLGAMIRCDPWGWTAPGNPALAARLAFKDAAGSQTRNGIYSGIFFSVLLADTLATGDPVRSIDTAAKYVPPRTRFAEMIRFVKERCAAGRDWEEVNAAIFEKYRAEAPTFNHSLPNAAIVLLGLLAGGGDFTRTVGRTVMAGMDTDCTGATVGSIMGCALGTQGIPACWTDPFNDTIHTDLAEMRELKISDVARRMFELARRNARYAGN